MAVNLPTDFEKQLQNEWPLQAQEVISSIQDGNPPTSVRLNPNKFKGDLNTKAIPWAKNGYYLPERPSFISDPWWHGGAYYVQEASSMLIEQAILQHVPTDTPITAIDLCAAPGGKTTHLQSLLHPQSLIIANEVIKQRASILGQNVEQWGCNNIWITNQDPQQIGNMTHWADLILVDAPCSGEGLFRRDHHAVEEWSLDHVKLCANRQQRIIHDVWNSLKPGGLLIYSTCTFNHSENEKNLAQFTEELGIEWLPLELENAWKTVSQPNAHGYHAFPGYTEGEGFFLAIGRKPFDTVQPTNFKKKKQVKLTPLSSTTWASYINNTEEFVVTPSNTIIQQEHAQHFQYLLQHVPIYRTGTLLGEEKGKKLVPSHAMALSQDLNLNHVSILEVNQETAYRYLKREVLPSNLSCEKGFLLVTYRGVPLGWVKNVGNRMNNILPSARRILKHFDLKNLWSISSINYTH
jgi:16S rRNA C967 or C1407 C5-methylase (RsmB/RsmF family)/NOL1/NOP2/fmu family ribosome biogenesis protein